MGSGKENQRARARDDALDIRGVIQVEDCTSIYGSH